MKTYTKLLLLFISTLFFATGSINAVVNEDKEYFGQFETALIPNIEDFEKVVFKFTAAAQIKSENSFSETAHLSSARLYSPQTEKFSVLATLVEERDEDAKPQIFVDLNGDNSFSNDEKFTLEREKTDNPFLWRVTVHLPVKDSLFTTCPLFLRYFKSVRMGTMTGNDRLITQSTDIFARGKVDVGAKKVMVQYAYKFAEKSIDPQDGWLGIDGNEDGEIDMDSLSPEAANADKETIVFRVGQNYFSTKKADLKKNQIILRGHEAKDYKRFELALGKIFPDFAFVDFAGKKRVFSEFRGKYILLDIWGLWCPPCRKEMPYLREAYRRFKTRNIEIVGLNTDPLPPEAIKKALDENGMKWTQARLESVFELLNVQLRIESFPTTFLISPEGKILSMSRSARDEPDLRGEDLLETLDSILPKSDSDVIDF